MSEVTPETGGVAVPYAQDQDSDAPPSNGLTSGYNDDAAFAVALAHAARSVHRIVGLSAGRYGVAATYGPGQRITGIVLRRDAPAAESAAEKEATHRVIEAHVVAAASLVRTTIAPQDREQGSSKTGGRPILLRIAEDVRRALAQEALAQRPDEAWIVDVFIEDLRQEETTLR
jgi:hypothetical protein